MNVNLSSVSASIRGFWDELVERRLWPFALALVVAIVAIPVLISKPAKQAPPPPPAPAANGASSASVAFQPAVSTEGKKSSQIRKDLRRFNRKNPFTPQGLTGGSSASAAGTAQPAGVTGSAGALGTTTGATSGGGSSSGGGTTTQGGSTGTSPKTSFYYTYTVDVKFGKTGNTDAKTLTKFRALPGSDNPVVVFMGVRNDGATAVFLVSADATTTGDGKCAPSDTECTFLYLKKGQTQTIEAVDADGAITSYTLKLKDVNVRRTKGPEKAKASSSHRSKSRVHLRKVTHNLDTFGF